MPDNGGGLIVFDSWLKQYLATDWAVLLCASMTAPLCIFDGPSMIVRNTFIISGKWSYTRMVADLGKDRNPSEIGGIDMLSPRLLG
jgi:hypothetical protein